MLPAPLARARGPGHRDRITRTVGPPPAEFWVPPVYPMIPGLSEIRTGNLVGNPEIPNTRLKFGIFLRVRSLDLGT
jgi:hypothetical protein